MEKGNGWDSIFPGGDKALQYKQTYGTNVATVKTIASTKSTF
jgi:hypothetical protein